MKFHIYHHVDPALGRWLEHKFTALMSAIADFATQQNAFNDKIDAAIEDLTGDIKFLDDKITEMQNNPGPISGPDQELLDALQARSAQTVAKIETLAGLTPPAPPTQP